MNSHSSKPIFEMANVSKFYGAFHVLKNVFLEVNTGEKVVLCGPSGSGKSTLIRRINGLETPESGSIRDDGKKLDSAGRNLHTVRTKVGMVFQQFNLFPHLTVLQNLIGTNLSPCAQSKHVHGKRYRVLEKGANSRAS